MAMSSRFQFNREKLRRDDVFLWNHEDESRTWVAPSLETYIEWRLAGKLSQ